MSIYSDLYKEKMAKQSDGTNRRKRLQQAKNVYDRNFADIIGYREATMWDRHSVDKGWIQETYLEVVVQTNTNGYEKLISCRPDTKLNVGAYVKFKEFEFDEEPKTYIIREILKTDPIPTYKAFECSQMLYVKGCPIGFPCFSYNSTYSSKGLIDTDRNYMLDSRNKLYIQKNKFSCRLWEHYQGYRIRMGDDDGWVTFKITEMDDFSYKGMFIVSLKVEQRHHLDGAESPQYAHNDNEIDFSDLGYELVEDNGNVSEVPTQIILEYDRYAKVGKPLEIASNKTIRKWGYTSSSFERIEVESDRTFKATPNKVGTITISITDSDGQVETINIIVKES